MATVTLNNKQTTQLDAIAAERSTTRDALLSDFLNEFLSREESRRLREQVDAAYTDPPNDVEAQREEAALFAARRNARRRLHQANPGENGASW